MCDKSDRKRTARLNRREFLAAFAGGAASVALEACSSPAPTAPMAQAPTKGGDLILGFLRGQPNLDLPVADLDPQGRLVNSMLDPLVRQQDLGKFAAGLAESRKVSPDAKVCTFKLHKEVKSGDGTPFKAEAVKFSFHRAIEPELKAQLALLVGPFDRSDPLDDYTIRVKFAQPFPLFLTYLSYKGLRPAARRRVCQEDDRVLLHSRGQEGIG